jgi:hypothetical protein
MSWSTVDHHGSEVDIMYVLEKITKSWRGGDDGTEKRWVGWEEGDGKEERVRMRRMRRRRRRRQINRGGEEEYWEGRKERKGGGGEGGDGKRRRGGEWESRDGEDQEERAEERGGRRKKEKGFCIFPGSVYFSLKSWRELSGRVCQGDEDKELMKVRGRGDRTIREGRGQGE